MLVLHSVLPDGWFQSALAKGSQRRLEGERRERSAQCFLPSPSWFAAPVLVVAAFLSGFCNPRSPARFHWDPGVPSSPSAFSGLDGNSAPLLISLGCLNILDWFP